MAGLGSIHNWKSGAPEQINLYEIMAETDGIYSPLRGGQESCMALATPNKVGSIAEKSERDYLRLSPK